MEEEEEEREKDEDMAEVEINEEAPSFDNTSTLESLRFSGGD